MAKQSKSYLSPTMQLWVTAVALVVGFICGLGLAANLWPGYQNPVQGQLQSLSDELSKAKGREALDHQMIESLARTHPEVYRELKSGLSPEAQRHLDGSISNP